MNIAAWEANSSHVLMLGDDVFDANADLRPRVNNR